MKEHLRGAKKPVSGTKVKTNGGEIGDARKQHISAKTSQKRPNYTGNKQVAMHTQPFGGK